MGKYMSVSKYTDKLVFPDYAVDLNHRHSAGYPDETLNNVFLSPKTQSLEISRNKSWLVITDRKQRFND